ncbi:hypothetical protein ERJ77_22325, partial [Vibrio anguillarum]|nr:hypothetical protein [Vibrio anguillarum]
MKSIYKYLSLSVWLICTTMPAQGATSLDQLAELSDSNTLYLQEKKSEQEFFIQLKKTAKKVGYDHAYASTMIDFKKEILSKEEHWNNLLSFKNLTSLVQDGVAKGMYLKAGIVDQIDSGAERVNKDVIYLNETSYLLRQYPELTISQPHWRNYLFKEENSKPSLPKESLMPRNEKERAIWKENVEIGWSRGEEAAYREIHS